MAAVRGRGLGSFGQAFTPLSPSGPAAPSGQVQLDWNDLTQGETGFAIWRSSVGPYTGFTQIDTVGAGVEQYLDPVASGTYWYRVQALGSPKNSELVRAVTVTVS